MILLTFNIADRLKKKMDRSMEKNWWKAAKHADKYLQGHVGESCQVFKAWRQFCAPTLFSKGHI